MEETLKSASFLAIQSDQDRLHQETDAGAALTAAGRRSRWQRNEACDSVIACGSVACIQSGAVRKFALRPNGQRQIIDLAFAGDYLGFSPAEPGFFLEAVSNDTVIFSFAREQIDGLAAHFPAVAALMQRCTADAFRRLEHHLVVQNRMTAREKVGAYLAEMSRRVAPDGDKAIVLPITRYDIADHLGIAVETVSRAMTALCRRGSIALKTPRDVEIRDPSMLSENQC